MLCGGVTVGAAPQRLCQTSDSLGILPELQASNIRNQTSGSVSSGGLAIKHLALGGNGHRFEPRKRSKLF